MQAQSKSDRPDAVNTRLMVLWAVGIVEAFGLLSRLVRSVGSGFKKAFLDVGYLELAETPYGLFRRDRAKASERSGAA